MIPQKSQGGFVQVRFADLESRFWFVEFNWHSRDWAIQGPPGAHAAAQPNRTDLRSGGRRRELAAQEIANCTSNFFMVRFECEVTGVVEMHFSVRVVEL